MGELFGGRALIGPDTEILDRVFWGQCGIVVNVTGDPKPFEVIYDAVADRLPRRGELSPLLTAAVVRDVIQERVVFSPKIAADVLAAEAKARNLRYMNSRQTRGLSGSARAGGGICHDQILLAGVTYRYLQQRRDLGGQVSVEVDSPFLVLTRTWLRHTTDEGERIIVNCYPPQSYAGRLEDSRRSLYLRPGETAPWLRAA